MADQDNDLKKFNHKFKTLRWWLSWFVNIYMVDFFYGPFKLTLFHLCKRDTKYIACRFLFLGVFCGSHPNLNVIYTVSISSNNFDDFARTTDPLSLLTK